MTAPMTGDPRIKRITYGHGSYGDQCDVCHADDYGGPIQHKPGCWVLWLALAALRAGVTGPSV